MTALSAAPPSAVASCPPLPGSSPQSTPQRIATELRDDVLDGVLLPGSRLREESLCRRFGTGRHTIRAALNLLVVAGLVTHERHRGASVRPLTRNRLDETFRFRAVIELGSLRLAQSRGADLTPVEDAVAELESLPDGTPWRRLTEAHGRIHHEIVAAAGNSRLLEAYRGCEDELQLLFAVIQPDFSATLLARLHRDLVDGLQVGGEIAVRALTYDLEQSGRTSVLRAMERRERELALARSTRPALA